MMGSKDSRSIHVKNEEEAGEGERINLNHAFQGIGAIPTNASCWERHV